MPDYIVDYFDALFNGEGWAVAVAFIAGIVIVWLINFCVAQYRNIQQWFQPIKAPAPQPTVNTPSGCARFFDCASAGCLLVLVLVIAIVVLAFVFAGDVIRDALL